jgi:ABC-type glycerol-3-phosphate transport system substrate-binding protein
VVFDQEGLPGGYLGFRMPDFAGQKGAPDGHLVIEDGVQISTATRDRGTYDLSNKLLHFLVTPQEQAEFVKVAGSLPAIPESLQFLPNSTESFKFAVEDTAKATVIATHLDTSLDREISDVYLRGYQELVNGTKTSQQIMQEVHAKAVEVQKARGG